MNEELQEALKKWDFYKIAKLTCDGLAEKGENNG